MALALRRIVRAVRAHSMVRAAYAYGVRMVGRQFTRFAIGAALALATSEITLLTCLGLLKLWPTVSAAVAWFAGATVSYVLSRWAWERRGRPDLLKETLPFWLIAAGTIAFLSLATSLAQHSALSMGLRPIPRLAFVGAAYLAANAVTFMSRFAIFHYILFADRGAKASARRSADSPGVQAPPAAASADAPSTGATPATPASAVLLASAAPPRTPGAPATRSASAARRRAASAEDELRQTSAAR